MGFVVLPARVSNDCLPEAVSGFDVFAAGAFVEPGVTGSAGAVVEPALAGFVVVFAFFMPALTDFFFVLAETLGRA